MESRDTELTRRGFARAKLIDAAFSIIRQKGYAATSVDELCVRAGVTKGAFFHHFPSKDALALAAVSEWTQRSCAYFDGANFNTIEDPLDRVLGYLEFRKANLDADVEEFTCLAGTIVQEAYATHPAIRKACEESLDSEAARVQADIASAIKRYGLRPGWSAESLGLHVQAVLQGAFILAKAKNSAAVAKASVDHLHRYVELLFRPETSRASQTP